MLEYGSFSEILCDIGLTKKKAAEICGVNVTTITRWCKRPEIVPVEVYHKFARLAFFIRYELK